MIHPILYQIIRPCSYLLIKDNSKQKKWIDYYIPLIISIFLSFIVCSINKNDRLCFISSIVSDIKNFLQMLPAFYLTALAALATFNSPILDHLLPPPTPKITYFFKGKPQDMPLTRRRLLVYLFGYLTFISLFLYIAVIAIGALSENEPFLSFFNKNILLYYMIYYLFSFLFIQMLILTLFSLYQVIERISIFEADDNTENETFSKEGNENDA